MTAQFVPVSDSTQPSAAHHEHLLDLLDAAAASQQGLIFLNDGIEAAPLKMSYAGLRDQAKVGIPSVSCLEYN